MPRGQKKTKKNKKKKIMHGIKLEKVEKLDNILTIVLTTNYRPELVSGNDASPAFLGCGVEIALH